MVHVIADPNNVSQYQRILLSEWKKDFPDKVLSLLWSSVRLENSSAESGLLTLLDPGRNGVFPTRCFQGIVQRMGDATRFVNVKDLPAMPRSYDPAKDLKSAAWQANRLSAYLTLRANTDLSGDVSFFKDLQALAFQAALHFALPNTQRRHPTEHSILLHALVLFPLEYLTVDRPAVQGG